MREDVHSGMIECGICGYLGATVDELRVHELMCVPEYVTVKNWTVRELEYTEYGGLFEVRVNGKILGPELTRAIVIEFQQNRNPSPPITTPSFEAVLNYLVPTYGFPGK